MVVDEENTGFMDNDGCGEECRDCEANITGISHKKKKVKGPRGIMKLLKEKVVFLKVI